MTRHFWTGIICCLLFSACIKDDIVPDIVDPVFRIDTRLDSLGINDSVQLEARFINTAGQEETVSIIWESLSPDFASIDENGLLSGIAEGPALITAQVEHQGEILADSLAFYVGQETIFSDPLILSGTIVSTSSYELQGAFTFYEEGQELVLAFDESYKASTALPGLYVYLTNNPNSVNEAFEIGPVEIFEGEHEYRLSASALGLEEFGYLLYWCKPFSVEVGEGAINE
ncbi:MAG: hypothetical protein GYB31_14765 [Bacteroidetes bacterium]|nr:hypothetical protein [Bacteroidota bacterium]